MSTVIYPNGLYAEKRHKIFLPRQAHNNQKIAETLQRALGRFSCQLDASALQAAAALSAPELGQLYKELFHHLVSRRGLDLDFVPLLQQESLLPSIEDDTPRIILSLGSKEDFFSIFTSLLKSTICLSFAEQEIIRWFISTYHEASLVYWPERILQKDNLALVLGIALTKTGILDSLVDRFIQSPADILRTFEAWSQTSPQQPGRRGKFRLPSIPRSTRKLLLEKLERNSETAAQLGTNPEVWKRIGERLHPGEFAGRFPKTFAAFTSIRNKQPIKRFSSSLEKAFHQKDDLAAICLLSEKPGEFARRLDRCLTQGANPDEFLGAFARIGDKIPSKILVGLWEYYLNRNSPAERGITLKHSPVVKFIPPKTPLPPSLIQQVIAVIKESLVSRFSRLPALGSCYLDPRLTQFTVPLSKRHASDSTQSLPPGTRLPCPGPALRFFIWWQEEKGNPTDIDLAACLLDENLRWQSDLSYYHLRSGWGFHSGDITSAPEGACEFIDVDLSKITSRYLIMGVYSFTGQPFSSLPKCLAGWQSRLQPSDQPTKLEQADQIMQISSYSTTSIPMVIDLHTNEIIWLDLALHSRTSMHNSFAAQGKLSQACRHLVQRQRVNLHDFLSLHIQARGVMSPVEQAQVVFTSEQSAPRTSDMQNQKVFSGWQPDDMTINFLI
jgi:hypothetical protein